MGWSVPKGQRVWSQFYSRIEYTDHCWLWTGTIVDGYGHYGRGRGNTRLAHRIAYELWIGPIPDGYEVDHLCRNKICVRPDHLEAVTCSLNTRRATFKTHCPHGHELTEDNVRASKHGYRACKICHREREAARRKR